MQALVAAGRGRNTQLEIPFEDFMDSGHMTRRAQVAMCSPDDLVTDYLPAFDPGDAEEIREAFGEACEQAVDGQIDKVRLDDDDVSYARQHFLEERRFRLVGELPDLAA
mgnify:FL=1